MLSSIVLVAFASRGPLLPVPVQAVASPSGAASVRVEPLDRDGLGPAKYEVRRDDALLWAHELPFTLYPASVTDAGILVGYTVPRDWRRDVRVVIVAADGRVVLDDRTPRGETPGPDAPPLPWLSDLRIAADGSNFVVRVRDGAYDPREEWWRFRIDEPARLANLRPHELLRPAVESVQLVELADVPGTGLQLAHAITSHRDVIGRRAEGALFALLEDDGEVAWTLHLRADYTAGRGPEHREAAAGGGAIVALEPDGTFVLLHARQDRHLRYRVERDVRSRWSVRERRGT